MITKLTVKSFIYEKAIKLLKADKDLISRKVTRHTFYEYEEAIQALEKQKNNGWIPVSEKLPEINKHVLLFLKDAKGEMAQVVGFLYQVDDDDFRKQFNGEFAAFDGDYVVPAFLVKELVVAWQPLPEPYKEVEND